MLLFKLSQIIGWLNEGNKLLLDVASLVLTTTKFPDRNPLTPTPTHVSALSKVKIKKQGFYKEFYGIIIINCYTKSIKVFMKNWIVGPFCHKVSALHCLLVLRTGPRPDWDPDVVAALDDALDLDDPVNILEDDFMSKVRIYTISFFQKLCYSSYPF